MGHVWERQPYDSSASYARFRDYYLVQKPPRSLNAAYRAYYAARRGLSPDDDRVLSRRASGRWQYWANGLDYDGQRILDERGEPVPTWRERADAYDDWVAAQDRIQNRRKRREIITMALDKALQAIANVEPSGDMREVAALIKVVLDQSRAEHHDQPEQNVHVSGTLSTLTLTADDLARARDAVREFEERLLSGSSDGDTDDNAE